MENGKIGKILNLFKGGSHHMAEIKVGKSSAKQFFKNLWYIWSIKYTPKDLEILEKKGWIRLRGWHLAPQTWDKKDPFAKQS